MSIVFMGGKDLHRKTVRELSDYRAVLAFLVVVVFVTLTVGGSLLLKLNSKPSGHEDTVVFAKEQTPGITVSDTVEVAAPAHNRTPLDVSGKLVVVKKNDSLGKIFRRLGLDDKQAKKILRIAKADALKNLRVGNKIHLLLHADARSLKKLSYDLDALTTLIVKIEKNGAISVSNKHIKPTVVVKYASARVGKSIYSSAKRVGIPGHLIKQSVALLGRVCNLKQVNDKDRFSIFYREYLVEGKSVKTGEIVALELMHGKVAQRIIAFKDKGGATDFYTPDGKSINPSFMRYPVAFKRIGSKFTHSRMHPILGFARPHLGVDLTAQTGTPVRVTSNGQVVFAGVKNGHGKTVIVKNGKYTTLYAHLSKVLVTSGRLVKMGEVVGHVGSTGLSTGPHLHYEFHINGVPLDPLKVALPCGEMVGKAQRNRFFALSRSILARLDAYHKANKSFAMHTPPHNGGFE